MNQNIDKVAFIHIENRKLLAARSKSKTAFYIPGGKREGEETDSEVLAREIKEELSIEIDPSSAIFLGEFRAQAHGKELGVMVVMQCYTANFTGKIIVASEIEEIGWLTSDDIGSERTSMVDWLILEHLKEKDLID